MPLLERIGRARAGHWIALSAAILAADYATGPFIQIAILFIIPVALATATHGPMIGAAVATVLPLIRPPFFYNQRGPGSPLMLGSARVLSSTSAAVPTDAEFTSTPLGAAT